MLWWPIYSILILKPLIPELGIRSLEVVQSLVARTSIFCVATPVADMGLELDTKVLHLRVRCCLGLQNNLVAFAIWQWGLRDQHVAFLLKLDLRLAARRFGCGGDDFSAGGLGFQRGVINGNADGTVLLNQEFGVLIAEFKEKALAGTGFDFCISKNRSGGKGGDEEDI
jgi:hypothetical protein